LGSAFDFTFRFLDSPETRALFTRPSVITELAEPLEVDDIDVTLVDASDLPHEGIIYIGTSALPYTSKSGNTLLGVSQGTYGKPKAYGVGFIASDSPRYFVGREIDLLATLLDPMGDYVTETDGDVLS